MIGRHTPPPGRIAATASIPGAWCELLHTSHPEFAAVIVITAIGAMNRWWAYRSRLRARVSFWLLRIQNWPSGWDHEHRSLRRKMPHGTFRADQKTANLFTDP